MNLVFTHRFGEHLYVVALGEPPGEPAVAATDPALAPRRAEGGNSVSREAERERQLQARPSRAAQRTDRSSWSTIDPSCPTQFNRCVNPSPCWSGGDPTISPWLSSST